MLTADCTRTENHTRIAPRRWSGRLFLLATALLLGACGSAPQQIAVEAPVYPGISYEVTTTRGQISLFDPADLVHHEVDPADWHLYDFGFIDDLRSGRFVAFNTGRDGTFRLRFTDADLKPEELAVAGPRAQFRLRVLNGRVLLAGGDAWPSDLLPVNRLAFDPRWIPMDNGDYRVVVTTLDAERSTGHDYVIQTILIDDMTQVSHAPGMPQLIPGQTAQVVGVDAGGFQFRDRCVAVPSQAEWSPLIDRHLPLPGVLSDVELPGEFANRGLYLQQEGLVANMPIVLSRETRVGAIGMYIEPDNWAEAEKVGVNGTRIRTRPYCAVRITGLILDQSTYQLELEPIGAARDRMPASLARELRDRFGSWIRLTSDPAWRYKSAQVSRTRDHQSLVLAVARYLKLNAKTVESLLVSSNTRQAQFLIDHMDLTQLAEDQSDI